MLVKVDDFAECAGRVGVRGLHPRVGSLCKNLAMEISEDLAMEISDWKEICNGDFQLERDLQSRFSMEICIGDFQWRF